MKWKKGVLKVWTCVLTISLLSNPVYAQGNRQAIKTAVGHTYYVDSVNGSDKNSGMSENEAFKTLSKINHIELSAGDIVYLKNGSEFNEQLKPKGKGTPANPITITNYGNEKNGMPVINGGGQIYEGAVNKTSSAVLIENMEYVNVSHLEVTNDDVFNMTDSANDKNNMKGNNQRRIGIHITINEDAPTFTANQRAWKGITVENCYVHDVDGDEQRSANKVNGGIGVEVFFRNANKVYPYFDGVTIASNTIEKVDRTGIKGIRLTELSLADNDGGDSVRYQAVRAEASKNQAGRNFVVRNNDLKNIGGDGILIDSTIKTVVERNTLFDHTKRSTLANAGIWCWNTQDVLFQYNESYGGPTYNQDGCSYDCDYNSAGTIFQYNYSHDTPMGFMLLMGGNEMDIVRYNISQNDGVAWRHFSGDSTTKSYIHNNVFYYDGAKWKWSESDNLKNNYEFINNIFYNTNTTTPTTWGKSMDWSKAVFKTNAVYEASQKNGINEIPDVIHVDPKFKNAGGGETKNWNTLQGYQLKEDSPLINKGSYVYLDLSGARLLDNRDYYRATQDFFGHPLYVGAPDIGVHEVNSKVSSDLKLEENGTYRLITGDGCQYLDYSNQKVTLNENKTDEQEYVFIKSTNGYKLKLLNSGLDVLYLSVENGQLKLSEKATIWQIEGLKNGLVKIKNGNQALSYDGKNVFISNDKQQDWYLELEENSKSFNCGGSSVEGYSLDQQWNEEKHISGRYGDVTSIGQGNRDVFSTAIVGQKFGYKFPVTKGSYNVKLSFNEIEDVKNRTFDILVNGEIYKEQFKIKQKNIVEEIGNVYPKNGVIDIQLVAAYNDDGVKTNGLLNGISLQKAMSAHTTLNMNCGSSAVDGLSSDAPFPTMGSGYYGDSSSIDFGNAGRPTYDGGMPTAMQTAREGSEFGYKFKLQPGNYRLKCLFNDGNAKAKEGERVFDIYVNGQLLVSHFDIVKEAKGNRKGVDLTRFVKSENGILDVKFVGKNGTKALVNVIMVDNLTKEENRENILLNKKATCSSKEGSLDANYVVDGSQTTRWGSDFKDNQWIQVDMGQSYLLDTVSIDWTYGAYAKKYRVEISEDGQKWTSVQNVTDAQPGLNFISFEPTEGRYLRIFGETRNDVWGMSITELGAYGTKILGTPCVESQVDSNENLYTTTLGIKNIYKRYTTMTVTLDYNVKELEYIGREKYLNPNLKFIDKNIEDGKIKYNFELMRQNAFDDVSDFMKFDFKAKGVRSPITVHTVLSDAAAHLTALPEIKVFLPNVIHHSELETLLKQAKEVMDCAEEGRLPGQYRKEDIASFNEVIQEVQKILDQNLDKEYEKAYTKLESAISDFKNSVLKYQYNHYYKNYSVDKDIDFEFNNASANLKDDKLHIQLNGANSTATDLLAPKLNSGTFIVKFDIDSLKDQIRFDLKNTGKSSIQVGYENGRWFWGGANNGAWGYFPNIENDLLFTDKTNEVSISFEKQDNGETVLTLIVNGYKVGSVKNTFSNEAGNYRLWTRYTQKNLYIHEVTYTNAPIYHIDVVGTDNGAISENGKVKVFGETDKTFIFTPNDGYEVDKVYVDGKEVHSYDKYTFQYIESDHTLKVTFRKVANKNELKDFYDDCLDLLKDNYTSGSWNQFMNALDKTKDIISANRVTQKEVDESLETLKDAKNSLVLKEADYHKVDEWLAKVPQDLSQYTQESVEVLNIALAKVERGLKITEQEKVDFMAEAIENAIKQLEVRKEDKPDIDFKPDVPIEPSIPDHQGENGDTNNPDNSNTTEIETNNQKEDTTNTGDTTLVTTFVGLGLMSLAGLLFMRRKED